MELSLSIDNLRKSYAISLNLDLPFTEVKNLNQTDRNYLYDIVKNSLETNRNPVNVLSANYNKTQASIYISEKNSGEDVIFEKYEMNNIIDQIESEAIYDTLSFIDPKNNFYDEKFYGSDHESIYIKFDEKIRISNKNLIFLKVFNSMYEVVQNNVIDCVELGGKYNLLKIKKYGRKKFIR